MQQRVIVGMSG
ncbi:tRNA 2-thiouridylase, partial [Acinetobacter sp. V2]